MKKLLLSLLALIPALTLSAQSLYLYQGNVVTVVNASTAGDMTYSGTTLTIQDNNYLLSEIDSIIIKNEEVDTKNVQVVYSPNNQVKVFVPIQLSHYLAIVADDSHVNITSTQVEGDEIFYTLSGTSTDGSFTQNGEYKCSLVLDGINLTSTQGAAINIQNGKRIDVYVADGTTNSLVDCAGGTQTACFRIKGHAEFKGNGTLNIEGNTSHAYKSNEYTALKNSFGGVININKSANDAIHVDQYFEMNNGTININNTPGDGIQVEKTTDPADEFNGQMILNGGTINMTLTADGSTGLKVESDVLTITGGTYTINMSGNNSDGVSAYAALITNTTSEPLITLNQAGGTLPDPLGGTKKSCCFKTESDMRFEAGTMNVFPTGKKAKGVKVGGAYYYSAKTKLNVTPEVEYSMIPIN